MSQQHRIAAIRRSQGLARIALKVLVVLLALAVVLGGVWTYYNVKWGRELTKELEAWKAQGLPLSMSEVIPKPVPDSENAAPIYLSVFHVSFDPNSGPAGVNTGKLADISQEEENLIEDYRRGRDRPKHVAKVRAILERPEVKETLQTLKRASQRPKAVFPVKWELGLAAVLPHMAQFRDATRMLAAQALLLAEDGQMADALDWCLVGLRMADHAAMEPSMIAQLVSIAMRNITLEAVEEIISDKNVPAAASRALQEHLRGIDLYKTHSDAMVMETLVGRSVFAQFRTNPVLLYETLIGEKTEHLRKLRRSYFNWLAGPLRGLDEATYLRIMRQQVEASRMPGMEAKPVSDALDRQLRQTPLAMLTKILTPVFSGQAYHRGMSLARIDLGRIALALKAYKAQHGQYPQTLAQLQQTLTWQLPKDVFTGEDFVYKREGDGFVIYSLGPDLDDDQGTEAEKPSPDADGDIAWRAKK